MSAPRGMIGGLHSQELFMKDTEGKLKFITRRH
jgi:hypothetical protein